jgi:hypothetical protein
MVKNSFMMNLLKIIPFIFVLSLFWGCDQSENEAEELQIEFGSVCGWCAGEEFITVTSSQLSYYKNIPCGDDKGTTRKSRKITASEWNEIIASFNIEDFKTLNYNTCNVCADGCDEIIRITENGNLHEIRYSPSDEIQETKKLEQFLAEILDEMRGSD